MTQSQIMLSVHEHYAVIKLNRPEKMNAISTKMTQDLHLAIDEANMLNNIKCLIITGAGTQAFSTGGDLSDLHGDLSSDEAFGLLYQMKEVLYKIASFPVPTIAVLNGQARGGGCELATACDFRFGVRSSSYGFVQGQLGITPGWGGGALLYEKIAADDAFLWLAEADMYQADKTLRIGWLHRILASEELHHIEGLAAPFTSKSLEQLKVLKRQYLRKLSILPLSAQMDEDVRACANLWESKEHKQAVERFVSSRKDH
ncbi:enoyl-CoA hydratase/isomerase family protein [Thalassobacillus sp. CUG 92003]|uniref:enoyl-CoA hydratase/isomerase family protein n=1 Tax=Thalassobacillus sp. CUG 92003 TaxID=2736641 RepID=UPI0015E6F1FA|nr:enoyl-CoA hydratase/isomerase family protein [Thalassobacillus sp. CUG 92003]